jgi:hypothetical protein
MLLKSTPTVELGKDSWGVDSVVGSLVELWASVGKGFCEVERDSWVVMS